MSRTCLVVDDSRTARLFARRALESMGYAISEAADGELALVACQQAMPDIVLLDWNMPVMNGIEFLKRLRQMPGGKKPTVLFCTTENALTRIEEAIDVGADEYIMKPFDADILSSKLAMQGFQS
jgi:two-component system chemotaxis response regulator CheY